MDTGATGPIPPDTPRIPTMLKELYDNLSNPRAERYRAECLKNDLAEDFLRNQLDQMQKDYNLRRDRVWKQLNQNTEKWACINDKYRNLLDKEILAYEKLRKKAEKVQPRYAIKECECHPFQSCDSCGKFEDRDAPK